jgi:hypothetical protein
MAPPKSDKPKTEKPYRTARGVSHGMAERPQRNFDSPPVTGLDPRLASELGLTTDQGVDRGRPPGIQGSGLGAASA